ncbi:MAG: RIP metalloprotease RseP [Bacteroidales bacterium]|nr:RIP metalloprotease RseP [Bacteroidales bacterium]
MKWLALIISLTLLVATHELGHLAFAKLFRTRVNRFYVFFNWKFSILKAKKFGGKWHFLFFNATTPESWDAKNLAPEDQDNTLWGLGWIPLGGYCDIAGMIDETKDEKKLETVPQPWEYRTKPAWQRLCIISGGVLVNFVSALILYGAIFAHWGENKLPMSAATLGYDFDQVMLDEGFQNGDIIYAVDGNRDLDFTDAAMSLFINNPSQVTVQRGDSLVNIAMSGHLTERIAAEGVKEPLIPRMPFVIKSFTAGSIAKRCGMAEGDSIVSVNDTALVAFSDIVACFGRHAGDTVNIGFYRSGELMSLPVAINSEGKIGVQAENDISRLFPGYQHINYTVLQAVPAGIAYGWKTLVTYVSSLKLLFSPGGTKSLGGFGTMASIFPDYWDWHAFWNITALLALILAFMNIIPIPGLDGGHIVFTLWEMITGKKPSDKFLNVVQNIGMWLLLALMILANGNDIMRWMGLM